MGAQRAEVAVGILFEVIAVDDDRRRGLALPVFLLLRVGARVEVIDDQHETLPVGRPRITGYAALDAGELHGLAAAPVEQPHLRAQLLLILIAALGDGCQITS